MRGLEPGERTGTMSRIPILDRVGVGVGGEEGLEERRAPRNFELRAGLGQCYLRPVVLTSFYPLPFSGFKGERQLRGCTRPTEKNRRRRQAQLFQPSNQTEIRQARRRRRDPWISDEQFEELEQAWKQRSWRKGRSKAVRTTRRDSEAVPESTTSLLELKPGCVVAAV